MVHTHIYQPIPSYDKGWECPKCGRVYSPHVQTCENCNPQQERTNKDQSALTNQLLNESKN